MSGTPTPQQDAIHGVHLTMALDLWMATDRDSLDYHPFVAEHGWALTWSLLLADVRPERPPCLEPTGPGDFCVFDAGHFGPHYGSDDVAAPTDLPPKRERPSA